MTALSHSAEKATPPSKFKVVGSNLTATPVLSRRVLRGSCFNTSFLKSDVGFSEVFSLDPDSRLRMSG